MHISQLHISPSFSSSRSMYVHVFIAWYFMVHTVTSWMRSDNMFRNFFFMKYIFKILEWGGRKHRFKKLAPKIVFFFKCRFGFLRSPGFQKYQWRSNEIFMGGTGGLQFWYELRNGHFLNWEMGRVKSSCDVFSRVKRVQKPATRL